MDEYDDYLTAEFNRTHAGYADLKRAEEHNIDIYRGGDDDMEYYEQQYIRSLPFFQRLAYRAHGQITALRYGYHPISQLWNTIRRKLGLHRKYECPF